MQTDCKNYVDISLRRKASLNTRNNDYHIDKLFESNGSCIYLLELCPFSTCRDHQKYCGRCNKITQWTKAFKLDPYWNTSINPYLPKCANYIYNCIEKMFS